MLARSVITLSRTLERCGIPGSHRLLSWAGALLGDVTYDLGRGFSLTVPVGRPENQWDARDVRTYERDLILAFQDAMDILPGPAAFVDCGADIGTMAVLVPRHLNRVERVFAIEPNPDAFPVLEANLKRQPVPSTAIYGGVADWTGYGKLRVPDYDESAHAWFVEPSDEGFPVLRIDDLDLAKYSTVIIKIDVEGAEQAVLRGAEQTIREAKGVVITYEANPKVIERTGVEPMAIARWLATIRPMRLGVCEHEGFVPDLDRPLFEQIPKAVNNVLCIGTTRSSAQPPARSDQVPLKRV